MVNIDGTPVQRTDYYPYGLPLRQTGASAQPYKFGAKEFDPTNALNSYDFHARQYFPDLIHFGSPDILAVKTPQISTNVFCIGNPIMYTDPTGMDTVCVNFIDDKWVVDPPVICEGNDVIVINDGTETSIITFDEGKYGNRFVGVVLEDDQSTESFGVYHLSGTDIVGYMLQPPGPESPIPDDQKNRRIPVGSYTTQTGKGELWYNYIQLVPTGTKRTGIAIHYGKTAEWSKGCILISYEYSKINGLTYFDIDESKSACWDYARYLGANKRTKDTPMPTHTNRRRDRYDYPESVAKSSVVTLKNR